MAAHLHDSVLQTLALVQQRADDPREVAALARRQERELRAWLSRPRRRRPATRAQLAAALEAAADEVERDHGVPVEVVAVGDAAARRRPARRSSRRPARRCVNAAKFGGGSPSTSTPRRDGRASQVFVRDRGPGFDPDAVPGRPPRRARVDRRADGAPRRPRRRSARRAGRRHRGRADAASGARVSEPARRDRRRPPALPRRRARRARGPGRHRRRRRDGRGRGRARSRAARPTWCCSTCTCPTAAASR